MVIAIVLIQVIIHESLSRIKNLPNLVLLPQYFFIYFLKRGNVRVEPIHLVGDGSELLDFEKRSGSCHIFDQVLGAGGAEPVVHFELGNSCFNRHHRSGEENEKIGREKN